jgi:hypothetical protein
MIAIHLESFMLFEIVDMKLKSKQFGIFGPSYFPLGSIYEYEFFEHFEIVGFL